MNPPVSIYIVTCLNTAERCDVLLRTCRNVLMQCYPNFEVVVSDNFGKFNALEVLSVVEDDRLKVYRSQENVGFAGNINRCLEFCSHDIIKLMCDDDLIHPDFLAQTVPHVTDETFVVTDYAKFFLDKLPESLDAPAVLTGQQSCREKGYGKDLWHLPFGSFPTATVFNKNLFRSLQGYDAGSLIADWDFLIKACLNKSVLHISSPLCYMGVWPESLTQQIHVMLPFYFESGGLYTKFCTLRNSSLGWQERMSMRIEVLREMAFQSCRVVGHITEPIYREGYMKYLHEWKNCFLNRKRSSSCYLDASMAFLDQ